LADGKTRPAPPYKERMGYGWRYKGQSNLEDAQELWEAERRPANVDFFPISELDALVQWCRDRPRGYTHPTK